MQHYIIKSLAIFSIGAMLLVACKSGTAKNDTVVDSVQLANKQAKQVLIGEWQPVRIQSITNMDSVDIVTKGFPWKYPWRYCFMENDTLYLRSNVVDENMIHNRDEWMKDDDGTIYLIKSWTIQGDTIFIGNDNSQRYLKWLIDSLTQERMSVSVLDDSAEIRRMTFEKKK